MKLNPTSQLAVRAAYMERHAPMEWQAFLQALAVYVEVHRNHVILSPLPDLPVHQGRAQSLSALQEILTNARTTAEKIEKANP